MWQLNDPKQENTRIGIYKGLEDLLDLQNADRLRSSLMHPMPAKTTKNLADIINQRLADPEHNPVLETMVYGGSIVDGIESSLFAQGSVVLKNRRRPKFKDMGVTEESRFSGQMQHLVDTVLFPGDGSNQSSTSVVRVSNMASAGADSKVGSTLVEYALWPDGFPSQGPDLIIPAFGANDKMKFEDYESLYEASESFLVDAYRNRCDGLPALILVDDHFDLDTMKPIQNQWHSQAVNALSTWHDTMALSYTRAFLHYVYSDPSWATTPETHADRNYREILYGDRVWSIHPAVFFHTGLAWLLVLQLLHTFGEYCHDAAWGEVSESAAGHNRSITWKELDPRNIPKQSLDMSIQELVSGWKNSTNLYEQKCSDPDYRAGDTCSYRWVVHRATSVSTRQTITAILSDVMDFNERWQAVGNPVRPPRPGWYGGEPNATFQISISATSLPIRKVTIRYLKSYGDEWKDSKVRVTLEVVRANATIATSIRDLVGVHNSSTSVNYQEILDVSADVGDTVVASFLVVSGIFKITGMLFCAR